MKRNSFFALLAILLFAKFAAYGQFYEKSRYSGIGMPFFEVEIFRTFAEDANTNRIYFWLQILNDDLTFVREPNGEFSSEFEIIIAAYNSNDEEQVTSKTQRHIVKETDFALTNSRERKHVLKEYIDLPKGSYEIRMQVNDLISKKTMNRRIALNVVDLSSSNLEISDLLFVTDDRKDEISEIIPRIHNNFPSREGKLFIHYQLFVKDFPARVTLNYRFETEKEEAHFDTTMEVSVDRAVTGIYFPIDKRILTRNKYNCIVHAEREGIVVERKKILSFYWVDVPQTEEDISMALRQMRYIVPEDSLDKYEELPLEEQKKFFKRFWAERDPNPNTEVNELMEEYFRRVNYAIREYSAFNRDGWLSDRGRILIKFGFPDDIERHPFEINTVPYEVWRYYNLRKVFVFSDKTGFGDYRLLPAYLDQEYR